MTDQPTLRDQLIDAIRTAACPGGGCTLTEEACSEQRIQPGAWERGVLSEVWGRPEHFADAVLAVLPAPVDRPDVLRAAEVWLVVWRDDEPVLGHYSDEVTAKLAAIEFQQDAEGPGHDFVYAWNEHGGHLGLLANGDDTGFRVRREPVLGETAPTIAADEMARLRAVDAAYVALVHRAHDTDDLHLIDAIARANRETTADLRRMADEAQQPEGSRRIPIPGIPECGADCPCRRTP